MVSDLDGEASHSGEPQLPMLFHSNEHTSKVILDPEHPERDQRKMRIPRWGKKTTSTPRTPQTWSLKVFLMFILVKSRSDKLIRVVPAISHFGGAQL